MMSTLPKGLVVQHWQPLGSSSSMPAPWGLLWRPPAPWERAAEAAWAACLWHPDHSFCNWRKCWRKLWRAAGPRGRGRRTAGLLEAAKGAGLGRTPGKCPACRSQKVTSPPAARAAERAADGVRRREALPGLGRGHLPA